MIALPLHGSPGARVLVVDDEDAVRAVLARLLEKSGFAVETAGNGATGLRMLDQADAPFHAVIADFSMPQMDGLTFLAEAARVSPLCSRVIVSGHLDHEDLIRAINTEVVFQVVLKPWAGDELRSVVHRAVNRTELLWANAQRLGELERERRELLLDLEAFRRASDQAADEALAMLMRALSGWSGFDPEGGRRAEGFLSELPELGEVPPERRRCVARVTRLLGAFPEPRARLVDIVGSLPALASESGLLTEVTVEAPGIESALVRLAIELERLTAAPGYDAALDWPVIMAAARTKVGLDDAGAPSILAG